MQRIRTAILALAALAAILPGGPVFAQAAKNETVFLQGTERHPARILPGRFALVLSDSIVTDADRYQEALDSLKGKPVSKLPRNIVAVEAPDLHDAKSLNASARAVMTSRPEMVVDSGIFVTIGESDLPFVLTDKIVVQIAKGKEPGLIQQVAREFAAEVVGENPFDKHQFVVKLLPSNTRHALEVSNAINGYPGISFAHPNFYRPVDMRQAPVIPNDAFFGSQWHLNNTGQGLGTVDADIDADLAWSFGLGNPNIIIAVIDDAFEINHPDLTGGLWTNSGETPANGMDDDGNGFIDDVNGWDFTTCMASVPCGDNNLSPSFGDKHGTPAAGAALARANNNLGVSGTCPQCTFLPVAGLNGPVFAQGLAFGYAQAMGVHIISNSWGYPIGTISTANVVTAINNAATAGRGGLGTVVLFAMNNSVVNDCTGPTPDISSLPNVIAVSRATNQDRFSPGGFGDCMDVLGPTHGGTLDAVTTDRQGTNGYNDVSPPITCTSVEPTPPPNSNRDYTFCFGGTSFATPVAAGVAGLVLSLDNSLTRQQVQRLLQDTADKISDSAGAYSGHTGFSAPAASAAPTHGFGRINAFEAVRTVAARAADGREGVDLFLRDNRLDWGNTEQPSNVAFEQMRGFIPHWQSVDIKVDAPPYVASPPATSADFEAFVHENPLSNTLNRVYVRVHNRGTRAANDVRVKLHWAFAGAGLPSLPADFWTVFPTDSTDVSVWHPLPMQTIASLPYSGASVAGSAGDGSVVLTFDFAAPAYNPTLPDPDHYCLFAVIDADDDPVSTTATGSQVPDFITPRDNNVTHRNVQLLNSGRSDRLEARIVLSNPFDYPIETRLVAWLPKDWKFATDSAETGGKIELAPGKSLPVEIAILPRDDAAELIDVVQLYRAADMEKEEVLGGTTYDVAPRKAPSRPLSESSALVELISQHQALVADYQRLVSQALSKRDSSTDDRSLLDRMGKLLEDQSRLLWEMQRSRRF